jgi:hypothetical protein
VITIKDLQVVYDADVDDEAVFARLFERHMARHEAAARRSRADDRQADEDAGLRPRGAW